MKLFASSLDMVNDEILSLKHLSEEFWGFMGNSTSHMAY